MDRFIRNIIHQKQSRIKSRRQPPNAQDGADGDVQIYNGRLYVKDKNIWESFSSDAQSVTGPVGFSAKMNGDQAITLSFAPLEFDVSVVDSAGGFDTTDYKYHIKQGNEGLYFIGVDVTAGDVALGVYIDVQLLHEDSTGTAKESWEGRMSPAITASTNDEYASISKNSVFQADVGDTFIAKVLTETVHASYYIESDKTNFYGFKIG